MIKLTRIQGELRMCTPDQVGEMLRKYFPRVIFNGYCKSANEEDLVLEEIKKDVSKKYVTNDDLDILKIATDSLFKPLFLNEVTPSESLVKELKAKEKSGEQPDVIKFFIEKEAEKFAAGLKPYLKTEQLSTSESTKDEELKNSLVEQFFNIDIFCQYECEDDKREKFVWDFNALGLVRSGKNSVYHAFRAYGHKNCTLYLFGVDFNKFKSCCENWPDIPGITKKLPHYLSKLDDSHLTPFRCEPSDE